MVVTDTPLEQRIARVMDELRVGVLVQGPRLEILHSNKAARSLLGLSEDELLERTSFDPAWTIVHEDGTIYPAEVRPAAVALSTGRAVRNVVMGIERPELRDRVWLLVDVEPAFDAEGRVVEVVSTLTDISDRKRLEESLFKAQKLESLGRLAGGIAHDFNNLLTGMQSYTVMVQDELPANAPARGDLDEVLAASERAVDLTQRLLTFASRQVTSPQLVEVGDALSAVERLLSRLLGEQVDLTVRSEPGCGPIRVDPAQFEQVLINLAVNARDAMPAGGALSIRASNVTVASPAAGAGAADAALPAGEYVAIEVIDTGMGMDAETRERLFEPFFTTKDVGKGAGLGLAIVHGVVEKHDGYLVVESEVGKGTAFRIYLPRATVDSSHVPAARATAVPRGNECILLVEDEEQVRILAARILERLGYTVLQARDGQDALAVAEGTSLPIALVVSDVVMPRLGGPALCAELRARWPALPVLLVSGYAPDLSALTHPFLAKPYTRDSLAREGARGPRHAPLSRSSPLGAGSRRRPRRRSSRPPRRAPTSCARSRGR